MLKTWFTACLAPNWAAAVGLLRSCSTASFSEEAKGVLGFHFNRFIDPVFNKPTSIGVITAEEEARE